MTRLNLNIISCNSITRKNDQISLMAIFDKIQCHRDKDEKVNFSLYIPYSCFYDSEEDSRSYYKLSLDIIYLEDKNEKSICKKLNLKEFRVPLNSEETEVEKVGVKTGLINSVHDCQFGVVTIDCNVPFPGEGFYQFEITGRLVNDCSENDESTERSDELFALSPFEVNFID